MEIAEATLINTYKGKKVFLTGHTGFKGSWFSLLLNYLGAEVKGFSLEAETPSLYQDLQLDKYVESQIGDIRNAEELKKSIVDFEPDFVFHFAAQSLVIPSYEDPLYTYETNVMGTANLLNALRSLSKKCEVVVITTDKVYHNNEWEYPYRETDRLGGYDPYSSSKACTELLIDSFRNSFFNLGKYEDHKKSIAVVRAGNVIGGGDWALNRIIPDIARAIAEDKPVKVRNPNAVRPWQHVLEALHGYLLIGQKLEKGKDLADWCTAWNFGPNTDENINVGALVEQAVNRWGKGSLELENVNHNFPHEAGLLRLDCSKAKAKLNWKPRVNGLESIQMTIDWYKGIMDEKQDPYSFTLNQIKEYLS